MYEAIQNAQSIVGRMCDRLAHRGPDAAGEYQDRIIALGHRRLRIIDINTGDQPVYNEDKTKVLIFNGEIYNYKILRQELCSRGHIFRTQTDSEVIVHLYEDMGAACVQKLNGMFSFAIWDISEQSLFLARDRFGQKPLFYACFGNDIVFASELKAIVMHPHIKLTIDRVALAQYLAYEYVPAPKTIYKDIFKLPAGHTLQHAQGKAVVLEYWDYACGDTKNTSLSLTSAAGQLQELLFSSVQTHLMSDVPLGVFLSGGIDSSIIAACAQKYATDCVKTFSVTFDDASFDESRYAKKVARFLGTEHYEKHFNVKELLHAIDTVLPGMDEPFADASLLPTALLSQFAREHVTVVLGGDGSDELLCGYPTFQAERLARGYSLVPQTVHERLIVPLAARLPVDRKNFSIDFKIKQFLKGAKAPENIRHQQWLGAFTRAQIEELCCPDFFNADVFDGIYAPSISRYHQAIDMDARNRASYMYVKTYLQDDILTKIDRASMMYSLEVRSPFLDAEVTAFIGGLDSGHKMHGLSTKHVLKKAAKGMIPQEIIKRQKKGFGIPIAHWFRNELQDQIADASFGDTLACVGIKKEGVSALVSQHFAGTHDHRKQLWTLFALKKWLDHNGAYAGGING